MNDLWLSQFIREIEIDRECDKWLYPMQHSLDAPRCFLNLSFTECYTIVRLEIVLCIFDKPVT